MNQWLVEEMEILVVNGVWRGKLGLEAMLSRIVFVIQSIVLLEIIKTHLERST